MFPSTSDCMLQFPPRETIVNYLERKTFIPPYIDSEKTKEKIIKAVAKALANQIKYPLGVENSVKMALYELQLELSLELSKEQMQILTTNLVAASVDCAKKNLSLPRFYHSGTASL